MATPNSKPDLLRGLLIVAAVMWVFSPVFYGQWLMDDDFYLTANALMGDPARLWKIWFAPGHLIEYYPLEETVQTLQWRLWGADDMLGYHLTNVILHAIGALLVWRLLAKFGLRFAWLGGFLFAVHPVMVESVAWIAELKNVLSLPPFLLAMCFWIDYEENRRPRDYLLALGFFLLAMLCKISMALFPLIIILYTWWKRGRIDWSDAVATIPFWLVSVPLSLLSIFAGDWFRQSHLQAIDSPSIGGFFSHLALAGLSLSFYLWKCLWPVGFLPIYPKWTVDPPALAQFLPWPVFGALFCWSWACRKTWGRHALLGLGFFVINLLPFIGLNSVSYMSFSWVMDHFLYLPMIGVVGLIIAGLEKIEAACPVPVRSGLAISTAIILGLLALGSHLYAKLFVSQETLWTYTVQRNPGAYLAHNNLGNTLFAKGRVDAAIEQYREALKINPRMVEAYTNLGLAFSVQGNKEEAIRQYQLALQVNPHFALAHFNLANTLLNLGRTQEAVIHYQEFLKINPGNAEARDQLAKLQGRQPSSSP
ncbi:MAG: tetratricopeptide repeat protein [Methylacidiphilales bacterium]|nr:tetratricopeptide repeat protein [Candidatus Methylacidiphilales bacterium]